MGRRNELEIAEDRARVAELLHKGYRSKTEIANIINVGKSLDKHITPEQVKYDIEAIIKKHTDRTAVDYNGYRNQLLQELYLLKKTLWEGYELSRRNKITIESEAILDEEEYSRDISEGLGVKSNENVFLRQAKTKEEVRLEGNLGFLQGVLSVIDREAKMVGIDAPSKVALTDSNGKDSATNAYDFMVSKLDELANRRKEEEALALGTGSLENIEDVEEKPIMEDTTEELVYEQ